MPRETWMFTEEDRIRLQPLVDKMQRLGNYVVSRACEIGTSREGILAIIQAGCEHIAGELREQILQQVDRGEWAGREPHPHEHPADVGAGELMSTVTPPAPEVLTVEQAAEFLHIGLRQMYEAIGRGEVPHQRIGRTIRLSRVALTKWLDARPGSDDND
jgi:excisionase family DNA binding protein